MYLYDSTDQQLVDERVAQFTGQTARFLSGQLTEDEFRVLRLQNGLYIQRHAPMLRVAIPYGMLVSRQLRKLAEISRRWDRGYGHFSTRQNMQFNWPRLEDAPAILAELATVSGGYPYFIQAYAKAAWDAAPSDPITAEDVAMAAPEAEAELAVGFFGSRYERATPAEREYLRAMAELTEGRDEGAGSSDVAVYLGRKPSSLSPARDSLIKKGLIYSAERGRIAFTVPHFGRFLLGRED